MLEDGIGLPTRIRTELSMAALGEFATQTATRYNDIVVVTIGTGLGVGVVIGGRLWLGVRGLTGEIGHIPVVGSEDALPCHCGRRGCLELYSTAGALTRRATSGKWKAPEEVVAAAFSGQEEALAMITQTGRFIALAALICRNAYDPEAIVLRGGFIRAIWSLISDVVASPPEDHSLWPHVPVKLSSLGDDGVFWGLLQECIGLTAVTQGTD